MSRYEPDPEALARALALGLHPIPAPLDPEHHTDRPASEHDTATGDALSWFLGTLFADVDDEGSRYWSHERTSVDEWTRVARALRIHGLTIVDADALKSAHNAAVDACAGVAEPFWSTHYDETVQTVGKSIDAAIKGQRKE